MKSKGWQRDTYSYIVGYRVRAIAEFHDAPAMAALSAINRGIDRIVEQARKATKKPKAGE